MRMGILDFLQPNQQGGDPQKETLAALENALMTLEDVIAPNAVQVSPRQLNVSGKMARSFYAISYPRFLNDGWLEPVLNMERELDVSIVIHPIDTADTLKKFQKKVAEVQSQI